MSDELPDDETTEAWPGRTYSFASLPLETQVRYFRAMLANGRRCVVNGCNDWATKPSLGDTCYAHRVSGA